MGATPVSADLVALANSLADAARPIAARYFRTPVTVDDKSDLSPVTIADREAETAMRTLLAKQVPSHGIFGEEHGAERTDAEYVWVLDPIDGTKAFITGLPVFGTLIALLHRGVPVMGVIDQPISKERWLGVSGQRSTLNGQPIRTRPCANLDKAYMYSTAPLMFPGPIAKRHEGLAEKVKLFRWGGDCYAYGLLAAGHVDLVVENALKLYDFAALVP
ncbi:MAG TPA: inositol monophosphatase family protein, partial [Reyranella sp.]|nr:inositol monophosphatase family protein [Reyranella sp.]